MTAADLPIPADPDEQTFADLDEAATIVETIALWAAGLDDPERIIEVRVAVQEVLARVRAADAELVARFCTLGREVTVDGKRYWPSTAKEAERWDSPMLVSRLAAVAEG